MKNKMLFVAAVVCIGLAITACRKEPTETKTNRLEPLLAEVRNKELQERVEKIERKLLILEGAPSENKIEDLEERLKESRNKIEDLEKRLNYSERSGVSKKRVENVEEKLNSLEERMIFVETCVYRWYPIIDNLK